MPIRTLTFQKTEDQRKQEYNECLDKHETALKSIVQKYEMLEEEKPVVKARTMKAPENRKEIQEKQTIKKESRKQLSGTPAELAPHIARVAGEFQFRGLKYLALEKLNKSSQVSKQLTISCGSYFGPRITWIDEEPPEDLPQNIGSITLQSLPNNKTLLIAKHTLSSFDSEGSYFDSFLGKLSLEFKNVGIEETAVKKTWRWFNRIIDLWNKLKP